MVRTVKFDLIVLGNTSRGRQGSLRAVGMTYDRDDEGFVGRCS